MAVSTIPSVIDGKPVISIGEGSFKSMRDLKKLVISEGIKTIGESAFQNCYGLADIQFPESIDEISGLAFENTQWFKNLPDGMIYINDIAWRLKGDLSEIKLKDGITKIAPYAFYDSKIKNIDIPGSVRVIGKRAFASCKNLEEIIIPDGVERIEAVSFGWCDSLRTVSIPESLRYIGSNAFMYCSKLSEIELPEGIELSDGIFISCISLERIVLPDSLAVLPDMMFNSCNSLKNIDLSSSLKVIGNSCFYNCQELMLEKLPEGLEEIGNNTFYGCRSLGKENSDDRNSRCFIIPASVCFFGENVFPDQNTAPDFTIYSPEGSAAIEYAVKNNIKYIIDKSEKPVSEEPVKPEKIFNYEETENGIRLTGLRAGIYTDIVVPSTINGKKVTELSAGIFYNNQNIKNVIISDGIKTIPYNAFFQCYSLESIYIPDSVENIDQWAFWGCMNLVKVRMSENKRTIGYQSFVNCSKLESISIGDKAESIGEWAFYNCPSMEKIVIKSPATEIGNEAFGIYNDKTNVVSDKLVVYGPDEGNAKDYSESKGIKYIVSGSAEIIDYRIQPEDISIIQNGSGYSNRGNRYAPRKYYIKLEAQIAPDNTTDKRVSWKSLNENVAVVDDGYVFSGSNSGTTVITASTVNGITIGVLVKNEIKDGKRVLSIIEDSVNLENSETILLSANDQENQKIVWKSTDGSVAIVNESGEVTAVGSGKAIITGEKDDTIIISFEIKVRDNQKGSDNTNQNNSNTDNQKTDTQKSDNQKTDTRKSDNQNSEIRKSDAQKSDTLKTDSIISDMLLFNTHGSNSSNPGNTFAEPIYKHDESEKKPDGKNLSNKSLKKSDNSETRQFTSEKQSDEEENSSKVGQNKTTSDMANGYEKIVYKQTGSSSGSDDDYKKENVNNEIPATGDHTRFPILELLLCMCSFVIAILFGTEGNKTKEQIKHTVY